MPTVETREPDQGGLNEAQQRHLLVSCQYVDKLLSDIEAILTASASRSPFPRYQGTLSPVQVRVVEDYISRIRARLVQALNSQEIHPDPPRFDTVHAIRTTLAFIDIAVEELKPKYMKGYGPIAEAALPGIHGIVGELRDVVSRLDQYLAEDPARDLQTRLARLEREGEPVDVLRTLERIIASHGLVEFRPTLAMILDRMTDRQFEIAIVGRVSSGKSSLLNHIAGRDVLPVGVNPVTAVPTRVSWAPEPGLTVSFADRPSVSLPVDRLADFVTEERNPANQHHVTRIVVGLPAARLRDGIVFVDTPGLGSLATSGAAETLAYLPRCDLGVVLVDAAATLSAEDLSVLAALYDAGTPASVVLSKADLITADERRQAMEYVTAQLHARLGLDLHAHAVSVVPGHTALLDEWFDHEIRPLCERHRDMLDRSIRRKVGALTEAVGAALGVRLHRGVTTSPMAAEQTGEIDGQLRIGSGLFDPARARSETIARQAALLGRQALEEAARELATREAFTDADAPAVVSARTEQLALRVADDVRSEIEQLASDAARYLGHAAGALAATDAPTALELKQEAREVPMADLALPHLAVRGRWLSAVSRTLARRVVAAQLRDKVGDRIDAALGAYAEVLTAWADRTIRALQDRFTAQADVYRARAGLGGDARQTGRGDGEAIQRDLDELTALRAG
jgi:GTPase Era involved in 16S rRNA processing